jgi:LysR family hydrogen peroxide-inducible transcriptional activator
MSRTTSCWPPPRPTIRMAAFDRVDPDSLRGDDMILLEDGHCLRDHALAACGLEPPRGIGGAGDEESFAATSLPTLVQMIGSGLGVSFLPSMAVAAGLAHNAPVTIRPLDSDHSSREIVVAWRAGSSRGAEGRLLAQTCATCRPPRFRHGTRIPICVRNDAARRGRPWFDAFPR